MLRGQILRVAALLLGDIIALYTALVLVLFIRYGDSFSDELIAIHLTPFTIIFALWLIVFYIAGIYDLERLRNGTEFWKTLTLALGVNVVIAIIFFYLTPFFGITPRTNLLLFVIVFAGIELFWRRSFNGYAARGAALYKIILVHDGIGPTMLTKAVKENPQLGYELTAVISPAEISSALEPGAAQSANIMVVPLHIRTQENFAKVLVDAMNRGIHVMDVPRFAELVLGKVPLGDLDESWLVGHNMGEVKFYDNLKRGFEFLFALALGIILLPLEIFIALLVMASSRGPAVYKQTRMGKYGKHFTLYKFRTMRADAERNGAQWKASGTTDPRLTWVGRILVGSHLDELPQLWNIVRGELSFVGPRPERPEYLPELKQKVPFYETRHLILPGVTGWAQINYRYGSTVDDAARKLEYDLYYIKNRSLILDIAIILKTLKSFFVNAK